MILEKFEDISGATEEKILCEINALSWYQNCLISNLNQKT